MEGNFIKHTFNNNYNYIHLHSAGTSSKEVGFTGVGTGQASTGSAETTTVEVLKDSLPEAELLNGRTAMMGIVGTTVIELLNGHPILDMVR